MDKKNCTSFYWWSILKMTEFIFPLCEWFNRMGFQEHHLYNKIVLEEIKKRLNFGALKMSEEEEACFNEWYNMMCYK